MSGRFFGMFACLVLVAGAAWMKGGSDQQDVGAWKEVAPGIWRSPGYPAGYALVQGDRALFIDAPHDAKGLPGNLKIDAVWLTHHHRASCAAVGSFLKAGVKVRAPKDADKWLTPAGVQKYWQDAMPLRGSRTAYLVVPAGFDGIDCSLADGDKVTWGDWHIEVLAAPGHALTHLAFLARKGKTGPLAIFCGGALAEPGKLWAPYTTDWDHWTDAGLTPAAKSLRKLAERKPALVLPAHGPVIDKDAVAALERTAKAVEDVGFLKSFERFTKERLGNAPQYRFLAKEQAQSNGSKPWSRVSEHLFLTGNTYVLTSKDNRCLMFDPWDKRSADQLVKLQQDHKLGPLEVVMFSHAHFDHYDGIYHLPGRDKLEVWMLDKAAIPVAEPFLLRAPFLDARPVKIDRRPKDGDTLAWREYRFRFHFFPGQTEYTMGVETDIDGKKCFFTADNFFHQDMFSGSGGWMGLNRSFPLPYAASARKVLEARPDWVLAEHGGPFEFSAEDFRRRVEWGKVSAKAADALSPSGNHRHDWDPHRVRVEPLLVTAKAGDTVKVALVADNALARKVKWKITLEGRRIVGDVLWEAELAAGESRRRSLTLRLPADLSAGRHIFTVRAMDGDRLDSSDAFLAIDVTR
jgi:glyoxylase-like metal-dependent hydrolase (beta-lactamase superfamily II)